MPPAVLNTLLDYSIPGVSYHGDGLSQVHFVGAFVFLAIQEKHVPLRSMFGLERTDNTGIEWLQNARSVRWQEKNEQIARLHLLVGRRDIDQKDQVLAFLPCPADEGLDIVLKLQAGHPRILVERIVHIWAWVPVLKASRILAVCYENMFAFIGPFFQEFEYNTNELLRRIMYKRISEFHDVRIERPIAIWSGR